MVKLTEGSVLDLPLEEQRRIAKEIFKFDDFKAWQDYMAKKNKEFEEMQFHRLTKAEIAERIHALRTNPEAIGFYQRVTENYDLTAEEQIKHLESLETAD